MQASYQTHSNVLTNNTKNIFPRSINPDGKIRYVQARDWTSGFYPGMLWLTYDLTKDSQWKHNARLYTEKLENEKLNNRDHDLGFKIMCSYGNGLRITANPAYKDIIIQSAKTLISRFDKKVGCIKSWDHHQEKWQFPVIIDNLMNLELLFTASKLSDDPIYYQVAVSHANKTLANHMREDGSCFHVVDYHPTSGQVMQKCTHQGYADNSSWARGQAWALYGFTMIYRETQDSKFLKQAEKTAQFILNHPSLAKDIIPLWDLDVPQNANEPKDASAAAIIASALYELGSYSKKNRRFYYQKANDIIDSLSSQTYFPDNTYQKGFLLQHSTGHKPKNSEINTPLIYADYYYLEALNRKNNLNDK
ncbi:glycoside hydrolase family 88 protein [Saccharicrinis fermentans]|uniref:Unsaturated glucuronyl hydrolase n=1 Tax=Saccharicrinis fermentans DSM 9555 = JCM 21142 TaxID=869213 RepID=W7Y6P1_9BACT|nr:glycoside hydrolase family 88 protein [Saccharicrinis fermentans]GAF03323.1 unsaturated glucuronyl hydrolase [Saccharicrinis fermentans DSM 9555 = JCM 21142]